MKRSLTGLAPAKVNLRLDVTGRREDGKHLLDMITARVSLFDELSVSFSPGQSGQECELKISVSGEGSTGLESAVRKSFTSALKWLAKHRGISVAGVNIHCHLRKHVPIGGGLGGGSSDVALFMKLVLKRAGHFEASWSESELISVADEIGADVPFFLRSGNSRVLGIGEKLIRIHPEFPRDPFLLVSPLEHVSTAEVFKLCRRSHLPRDRGSHDLFSTGIRERLEWRQLGMNLGNDLEAFACILSPKTKEVLSLLRSISSGSAGMSGSGSTLFILPKHEGVEYRSLWDEVTRVLADYEVKVIPVRFLS